MRPESLPVNEFGGFEGDGRVDGVQLSVELGICIWQPMAKVPPGLLMPSTLPCFPNFRTRKVRTVGSSFLGQITKRLASGFTCCFVVLNEVFESDSAVATDPGEGNLSLF